MFAEIHELLKFILLIRAPRWLRCQNLIDSLVVLLHLNESFERDLCILFIIGHHDIDISKCGIRRKISYIETNCSLGPMFSLKGIMWSTSKALCLTLCLTSSLKEGPFCFKILINCGTMWVTNCFWFSG